ncbi:hypothetical protein FE236_00820 [Mariprofundus erugo]|uniref:PHP domain-containing protein n=1 Tax=Mariprofundus erugo TaxID=2528639 RepID=UPI0010FF48E6|nr:hypothetical protein [Mariprofundus erugo]TLS78329.1 hypothetical protein FE236_00820 [Mariprofundus erugo]
MKTDGKSAANIPPAMIALYAWIALITFISLVFGRGVFAPVDPRTDLPVQGVHLAFSARDSVVEPFTALFHLLETLPDYKSGIVVFLIWIVVGVSLFFFLTARRRGEQTGGAVRSGIRAACVALMLYGIYICTALTSHFPNWTIVKDDPAVVVADLHTHSIYSHDGVIAAKANMRLHKLRGYDLVAFTEHVNPWGPYSVHYSKGEDLAVALAGIEIPVYYGGNFYLIAIGMERNTPLPNGLAWSQGTRQPMAPKDLPSYLWNIDKFIATVHAHHGIIFTVAFHLNASDVTALAEAGVDGFEYINFGHPPLHDDVRQALLNAQQRFGVALLACNDWHGWTGALNVWTLIYPPAGSAPSTPEEVTLAALRAHDARDIVPAVAYPVHPMHWQELVVAPFTAVYSYGKTISGWQLLSWWLWAVLLVAMTKLWRQRGYAPAQLALRLYIVIAGLLALINGATMLVNSYPYLFSSPLNYKTGWWSMIAGLMLLLIERVIAFCNRAAADQSGSAIPSHSRQQQSRSDDD